MILFWLKEVKVTAGQFYNEYVIHNIPESTFSLTTKWNKNFPHFNPHNNNVVVGTVMFLATYEKKKSANLESQ